MVSIKNLG